MKLREGQELFLCVNIIRIEWRDPDTDDIEVREAPFKLDIWAGESDLSLDVHVQHELRQEYINSYFADFILSDFTYEIVSVELKEWGKP